MRILLADGREMVRYAVRVLLVRQAGLEVIGEAANAEQLLTEATACPDLVLLDWELPGLDPVALMANLRERCPDLNVIVLSGRLEARQAALDGGASAFVSKADPPEQLLASITRLQRVMEAK